MRALSRPIWFISYYTLPYILLQNLYIVKHFDHFHNMLNSDRNVICFSCQYMVYY